jgi:hypothetical protein
VIDLHTHSTCSDGSETPVRVVELAAAAGCTAVSLTDHDGLFGIESAARRAREMGIYFVAGCEVSCTANVGPMHLLCYFVTDGDNPLAEMLRSRRVDRETRNAAILQRFVDLGIPLSSEEVAAEAHGPVVGRPHFAAALVHRGVVGSIDEAFARYLRTGAPAFVARTTLDPVAVIEGARASGAVAALAHPLSLGLPPSSLDEAVAGLAAAGLAGLEAQYGHYEPGTREHLVRLAARHGLVATGGSDFHGTHRPLLAVGTGTGDLAVPEACLDELARRLP